MRRALSFILASAIVAVAVPALARQSTRKPAPRASAQARPASVAAAIVCPRELGVGVGSKLQFCDVMTGRGAPEGIKVPLPPRRGDLVLTFDLHNRHTYSDEAVLAKRGYTSYTATVAALAPDNTVLGRGVIQSDFRTARDLLDRVGGGAGPRGVKAVAPLGTERIRITVPQDVKEVSLVGEKLTVVAFSGTETFTFAGPSRPIAVISNVRLEYTPIAKAPVKKAPVRKAPVKKAPAKKR